MYILNEEGMKRAGLIITLLFVTLLSRGQMLPLSNQQLISTSENIVSGAVLSANAQWVNSGKYIYTFIRLKVDKVYSGTAKEGDTLTIVVPGGYDPVKDMGMKVSDQAEFETGEEDVVFLTKAEGECDAIDYSFLKNEPNFTPKTMRVNGYSQGKRKIFHDKKTDTKMISIPNENRTEPLKLHDERIEQKLKLLKRN